MAQKFYIGDTHFGHANVIKYDERPFASVEEMDEAIIANWNSRVTNSDLVYILGDLSWHGDEKTIEILERLNGSKILIRGNHDELSASVKKQFAKVCDYLEVKDNGTKVILSHYPMPFWNGQFQDTVHLYAHIHNTMQYTMLQSWQEEVREKQDIPMRMFNVGCMMPYMDYGPKTLMEIIAADETQKAGRE